MQKIKHMRCQHLLCSTSPRSNIRPDGDNLIDKLSCYDKDGLVINGYSNVLMELKCVIRFISQKILCNIVFVTTLKEKCVGKYCFDIKQSDKLEITTELQIKLLEFMNNLSINNYMNKIRNV